MKRNLLGLFLHEYYQCPERNKGSIAIDNFLKDMRKTLDSASHTAKAIDQGLSLDEIVQSAYRDGFFKLARTIRIADSHQETLNKIHAVNSKF